MKRHIIINVLSKTVKWVFKTIFTSCSEKYWSLKAMWRRLGELWKNWLQTFVRLNQIFPKNFVIDRKGVLITQRFCRKFSNIVVNIYEVQLKNFDNFCKSWFKFILESKKSVINEGKGYMEQSFQEWTK